MHKSANMIKKVAFRKASQYQGNMQEEEEGKSIKSHSMNYTSDKKATYNHQADKEQYSMNSLKNKFKASIIFNIKNIIKGNSLPEDVLEKLQLINSASTIDQLIEKTVQLFSDIMLKQKVKQQNMRGYSTEQNQRSLIKFPLRVNQTKLLRLVRDERPQIRSASKFEQLESYNDALRKELFELKEEKQQLEKRMLELIEEYRNRKGFYLAQIKKLTDIINMSSLDVRTLILQKTKEAREQETKKDPARYNQHVSSDQGRYYESKGVPNYIVNTPRSPRNRSTLEEHSSKIGKSYNTEVRMLKGINSVEHIQEFKNDSSFLY